MKRLKKKEKNFIEKVQILDGKIDLLDSDDISTEALLSEFSSIEFDYEDEESKTEPSVNESIEIIQDRINLLHIEESKS